MESRKDYGKEIIREISKSIINSTPTFATARVTDEVVKDIKSLGLVWNVERRGEFGKLIRIYDRFDEVLDFSQSADYFLFNKVVRIRVDILKKMLRIMFITTNGVGEVRYSDFEYYVLGKDLPLFIILKNTNVVGVIAPIITQRR